ncbi:MAG: protein btn-1, partial [Linnemannia gamsii]
SFVLFSINNLIYVVILSAAVDLVGAKVPKGVVLLADITPSLLVKTIAPYFVHKIPYWTRVVMCATLSFSAVVVRLSALIAQAETISVRLLGVMMASLSAGLGELTFLMLSSFYRLQMVSAWSSGTGGAGLLGALLFLALTSWFGLSIPRTLAVISLFPIMMLVAYFVILTSPPSPGSRHHHAAGYRPIATASQLYADNSGNNDEERFQTEGSTLLASSSASLSGQGSPPPLASRASDTNSDMTMPEKRAMARSLLLPFMFPLFLVYFAEYTMNQGVLPVVLFPLEKTPFTHMRDHYATYSAIYQLGVFISRSSASLIEIQHLWIPSFLQVLTLLLATSQAILTTFTAPSSSFVLQGILTSLPMPLPNIYIVFLLIFWEGLLGGATYVHTYIGISKGLAHDPRGKEFALGVVGVADGLGILLAGLMSLWIEPSLCRWQVVERGVELCLSMAD